MARREARLTILSGDEGKEWLRELLSTLHALQFTVARIEFAEEDDDEPQEPREDDGGVPELYAQIPMSDKK